MEQSGRAQGQPAPSSPTAGAQLPIGILSDGVFETTAGRLARLGSWSFDVPSGVNTWSGQLHVILGYPAGQIPTPQEVIARHEERDQQTVNNAVISCAVEGTPFDLELPYTTFDDRRIWMRLVGEAVRDDDGRIVRVDGIFQDVTTSRHELERRRRLADQYVSMLESLSDGFISLDERFVVTWVNRRFEEMFEIDPGTTVGQSVWALLGDDVRAELEDKHLGTLAARRPFSFESRFAVLDRWFEVRVFPNREGVACLVRDVTAERSSRTELEFHSQLLADIHDAVFVCDPDGRITFWGSSAERVFGWSGDDAMGRDVEELLAPSRRMMGVVAESLADGGSWSGELTMRHRDGREVIVDGSATFLRDGDGRVVGALAVDRDVTDRRHLEHRLLRAQRLESIGTLAGGLAHNLNNTLAPIVMAAELLREVGDDLVDRADLVASIESAAQRGSQIVHQMLTFARGTGGQRRAIVVDEVVTEVVELSRNTMPLAIDIEVRTGEGPLHVLADPTELHQVLLNLCVNARDAMPDGGTVTVEVAESDDDAPSPHDPLAAPLGRHLCIAVCDTGHGMTDDVAQRVYEPFFTTKQVGEGTGLGVPTAVSILRAHGGFLTFRPRDGGGTRAEVHLPLHREGPVHHAVEEPEGREGGGRLVVVVDDEPDVARLVSRILEGRGFRTAAALGAVEALELLDRLDGEVDVLLTDLMMPEVGGVELLTQVGARYPRVALLAMSGVLAADEWPRAQQAGARWLVAKPFRADDLLDAIDVATAAAR